jgi:uncharacterized cupredoxin-like copper-binding protein
MFRLRSSLAAIASATTLIAHGAAAQSSQPPVISVDLSEYHISPPSIELKHGQSYVLRVTNTGHQAHALSARAFFASSTIATVDAGVVRNGSIEVAPGESADLGFVASAPGTYEAHCPHPFHSALGMKGQIVVR